MSVHSELLLLHRLVERPLYGAAPYILGHEDAENSHRGCQSFRVMSIETARSAAKETKRTDLEYETAENDVGSLHTFPLSRQWIL